jgi:hypothetical protein
MSEGSLNQMLKAIKIKHLSTSSIVLDEIGGIICSTKYLNDYLQGFEFNFGANKICKYQLLFFVKENDQLGPSFIQLQAGDIYLETFSF